MCSCPAAQDQVEYLVVLFAALNQHYSDSTADTVQTVQQLYTCTKQFVENSIFRYLMSYTYFMMYINNGKWSVSQPTLTCLMKQ